MLELSFDRSSMLGAPSKHRAVGLTTKHEDAELKCLTKGSTVSLVVGCVGKMQHAGVLFSGSYRVTVGRVVYYFSYACAQRLHDQVALTFSNSEGTLLRDVLRPIERRAGRHTLSAMKLLTHRSRAGLGELVNVIKADLSRSFCYYAVKAHHTNCLNFALQLLQVLVPKVNWSIQLCVHEAADSDSDADADEGDGESEGVGSSCASDSDCVHAR